MSKRDAEQVQKVLSGDQTAYEPLVEAYQGRIYAFVAGRIRNFSATEDIVQNAFVEAYMHLKSLKSPEKFSGWLRGIALNLSNKWLQQKRPIISIDDTSQDVTPEISEFPLPDLPDEALEKTETKETVIAAVDALPDIYREAVLLHYMEGMTYPEIAAFLDIPESTVTGRLQVSRNRLRDELMPLVEDTLREKRPTPQLTRKIIAALPLLLYAVPTQASLLAKLKGTGMIKIMGIIGAGIAGTGLYFGGISAVLNLEQENTEPSQVPQIQLELENLAQNEPSVPEKADETEGVESSRQEVQSDTNTSGDTQTEKLDFRMETSPQDSLVKIVYWLPEIVYSDSVFIELECYNNMGMIVARPVNKMHNPGSYTTFLSKQGLPDGIYFVQLRANQSKKNAQIRKLNLIWTDRK
ncbi:MAG: RNA polymerase sigma factor [Gemmatimonadetes bacterium]|nr:RNA polymerase sigma factor [Gemmatimonadota bacterium]